MACVFIIIIKDTKEGWSACGGASVPSHYDNLSGKVTKQA